MLSIQQVSESSSKTSGIQDCTLLYSTQLTAGRQVKLALLFFQLEKLESMDEVCATDTTTQDGKQ